NFDVVHLEGLYMCLYIPVIRKYSKAHISYRAHNVEFKIWERLATQSSGLKKWYLHIQANRLKKFELEQMKHYDALVAITDEDARAHKQLGFKGKVFTAPFGIELSDYSAAKQPVDFPSLFHIGAMDWMPNQEGIKWFVDEVWSDLHHEFPQLKLYLAGKHFPDWLQKLQRKNIVIEGEVADSKKFISEKALMIVPLFSGSGIRVKII